MRATTPLCIMLVLLAACGAPGEDGQAGTEPAGTGSPPTASPGGGEIRGVLGGDPQLEGGCAWVETDDGTRYEVRYPDGYAVDFDPLILRGPDGQVVAEAGDRLVVGGAVADEQVSICQVGPIWRAEEVRLDAGAG